MNPHAQSTTLTFVDVGRQAADEHLPREALRHLGALRLRRRARRRAHRYGRPIAKAARFLRYVIVQARIVGFACKKKERNINTITKYTNDFCAPPYFSRVSFAR